MQSALPELRQKKVRLLLFNQSFSQLKNEAVDMTSIIFQARMRLILASNGDDADIMAHEFASITYDPRQAKTVDELLAREQGVILFCGAEQDGVQSTLNACVRKLAVPSKHVVCVESYVDQWVQDADQFNAKGDAKLFAQYLHTALSHSPDVLKVRPMDSREAWDLCLRESLRGPLILGSTFARDAAEALANVVRGGADASLISSGLLAIVVQRKLRLNCQHCQQKETVQRDRLREIGIPIELQPAAFYYGAGCDRCFKTGFGNETHIFEIMVLNDDVKNILHKDVSADKIRSAAKTSGMLTLRQVAVHKAIAGQTSLAEVVRVSPK
jgi:type II secretory ATPase GspE/PulE/Tfp pilus assembly ATPase PilB-like protein